ncbi:hypothetical protein B0H34DRAFT_546227 [Crassisporium funariophilum]|nr:hypothetical protein B0H34DRAFT_546227 [Crassisporium funariophilum]
MFLYDYLLTLSMEIDLVWTSRWNLMKTLYLVQRYLPFVDTVWLVLHHQLGANLSTSTCTQLYTGSGWGMIVGIASSELILTLRAWAVWRRDRNLGIFLFSLYTLCWAANFVLVYFFIKSIRFGKAPIPHFSGCFVVGADQILFVVWVILMIWDALVLVLIMIPGYQSYRYGGHSALYDAVYRDGAVYYLYIFVLSTINIVVIKMLPTAYQHLLTSYVSPTYIIRLVMLTRDSLERCLHSVLASRILLHIRVHAKQPATWLDMITELQTQPPETALEESHFRLHVRSNTVGNDV